MNFYKNLKPQTEPPKYPIIGETMYENVDGNQYIYVGKKKGGWKRTNLLESEIESRKNEIERREVASDEDDSLPF
jgi:hypothetical protein